VKPPRLTLDTTAPAMPGHDKACVCSSCLLARRAAFRDYDRKRKAAQRAKKGHDRVPTRFIGVDGEGGNINGSHEYLLLRAGDWILETGSPLRWQECLAFLSDLPKDGVTYVAYFFDYDVTMILSQCREERVRRLLDRESRTFVGQVFPVDVEGFQIDYLPRKEFKVRRKGTGTRWTVIHDVGTFFQSAFLKTLELWDIGTPEERTLIAEGKESRKDFGAVTDEERFYNDLECKLLSRLMYEFRNVCVNVGYVPSKWQGPGCMATTIFRRHGIPTRKHIEITGDLELMESANAAYYGGRFETTRTGPVDGPVYQYDINSAYPVAVYNLPCLMHGIWEHVERPGTLEGLYLARGHFVATSDAWLYGFPVRRKDGSILFPAEGNGWYWSHEIASARHQSFKPAEAWRYVKTCECRPFDFIPDLYRQRVALGKTAKGRILKLSLNSLYGKTAQSIGAAAYANPIWAGLITSRTRATLLDAICNGPDHGLGLCGKDVLMLATDGIFTTAPRRLPVSDELGDWEATDHGGIFLIQPGLYLLTGQGNVKTRGLPRRVVEERAEDFYAAYRDGTGEVMVSIRNFVGLRQALHRNRFDIAGQWQDLEKAVTFDISSKRDPETGGPYRGGPDLESVPYAKAIGAWNDARIDLLDQPDWADGVYGEDWS
jgi:hypothetical protein